MNLFAGACPDTGFPLLDNLPWSRHADMDALRAAREVLVGTMLPGALAVWLETQPQTNLQLIADRSIERSTHFKWFLGGRPGVYTVWLHEYKSPASFSQAVDFAASVHNHRYGFCSRVLSGALHVSDFVVDVVDAPPRPRDTRTVRRGDTMILSHEDVHRVDRVDPGTCTLLVQGPAARGFSTRYEVATGRAHHLYDLQHKLPRTIDFLGAACDIAASNN